MKDFSKLADKATIEETIKNLIPRGIEAFFVENKEDAKNKVLELMPKGSHVLVSASKSLEEIGVLDIVENSGDYISVRKEYMELDHEKDADKIRVLRSTPDIITASVHAVTKQGEILIASNTGSQLAGFTAGAGKVIWVVGAQKIVETLDEGFKRVYEYVLKFESDRLYKLYKVPSNVSQLLIFNKSVAKYRVKIIFVNEVLGF